MQRVQRGVIILDETVAEQRTVDAAVVLLSSQNGTSNIFTESLLSR
jgi:hypothetical protein